MPKEIKAYKPDCCNKAMMYKSSAIRHEENCFKNPVNKSCYTCKNQTTHLVVVDREVWGRIVYRRGEEVKFCSKKDRTIEDLRNENWGPVTRCELWEKRS